MLFRFIPKDTVFIFLDSEFETIYDRRAPLFSGNYNPKGRDYGVVPRSAVEPREFINFQRRAYKMLARSFNAYTINTSKLSIKETSEEITKFIDMFSKSPSSHGR